MSWGQGNLILRNISNSYTMVVRGDNPRALARRINHGITILYHPHQYEQYEIIRAKVCHIWQEWDISFVV